MSRQPTITENGAKRWVYIALGLGAVGLGALGAVVPGMPSAVFLLIASFFFARSSPRLYRWLNEHPRFGPYLELVRQRAMPWRAKVWSLVVMWVSIATSCVVLGAGARGAQLVVAGLGLVGTGVLLFYVRTLPEARLATLELDES